MKKYATCVRNMEARGMTRRQIADIVGIDEAVMSRRMNGKQEPIHEAVVMMNIVHDIFTADIPNLEQVMSMVPLNQNSELRRLLDRSGRFASAGSRGTHAA